MLTEHILSLGINCLLYQENSFLSKMKNLFCQNEGRSFFFSQSTSNNFRIQNKATLITTISEHGSQKKFKSYLSFLKVLWNYSFSHEEFHENFWWRIWEGRSELWFPKNAEFSYMLEYTWIERHTAAQAVHYTTPRDTIYTEWGVLPGAGQCRGPEGKNGCYLCHKRRSCLEKWRGSMSQRYMGQLDPNG